MKHIISEITLQKKNRHRVNISLDGEFAFGLSRIVAGWLQVGQELSETKIQQLLEEDHRESAYQRALNYLHYRPRSENELRKYLELHSNSEETINYVIDRLTRSSLLDDTKFAHAWVENRLDFRPRSRRALSYELLRKGIEPQIIEECLSVVNDDEIAYQAALKRAPRIEQTNLKDFAQKMVRYLGQRGFSYRTSSEATTRVWEEIQKFSNMEVEEANR